MKKSKKAQHKSLKKNINNDWQLLLCLHCTLNVFIFLVSVQQVCALSERLQVFSLFVFLFTWTMGSPLAFIYSKWYVLTKSLYAAINVLLNFL